MDGWDREPIPVVATSSDCILVLYFGIFPAIEPWEMLRGTDRTFSKSEGSPRACRRGYGAG